MRKKIKSSMLPPMEMPNFPMSKKEEKSLRRQKRLVRRTRLAWQYAPDRLEAWLEAMERKGYNLYRISKTGLNFYFLKGAPRKIKYVVDHQKRPNPEYYNLNIECGWTLAFTSGSKSPALAVWVQAYSWEEEPEFYSDIDSKLEAAKRVALTYSLLFFPICISYAVWLAVYIFLFLQGAGLYWFRLLIQSILTVEFGFFAFKSIFYYFRIKKKAKE